MARYKRRRYNGRPSGSYRTRYYSTRSIAGLYRSSARYRLTGRGRRMFGKTGIKAIVRSMAEKKYYDLGGDFTSTRVQATGILIDVSAVPLGQTDSERIGDKVTGTSFEFRSAIFNFVGGATDPHWMLRTTIFIWRDDTVPTLGEIFNVPPVGILSFQPGLWPFNHDRKVKRKILADWTVTAQDGSGNALAANTNPVGTSSNPYIFKKKIIDLTYLKGGLSTINFQSGTGTGVNKIYVFLISNVSTNSDAWNVVTLSRYNYIDM